jgi:hypothetical protein
VGDTNFFILLTVVVAPAWVVGLRELWRMRRTGLAAAAASALAVWLGYAALGVAYFWWYLAVPLMGIVMTAAVGLPRLTRGPALYVSLALATAGVWTVTHNLYIGRSQNEASFARVASFLVGNAQPGQAVFLEPIGVIGFSAPLRVIDEVGLVSPRVAERRLGGPGWYTDIVEAEQPEWIVVRYGTVRTGTGFAGIGQLFRTEEEWRALFARYQRVYPAEGEPDDQDLVVMKRL